MQVESVYQKVYDDFILPIDAIDNGVNAAEGLRYRVKTDLSSRCYDLSFFLFSFAFSHFFSISIV